MKYRVQLVNPDMNVVDPRANWFRADHEVMLFDSLEESDIAGRANVDAAGPWDYGVEEAGE